MSDRLARALTLLALAGLVGMYALLVRTQQRVDTLEQRLAQRERAVLAAGPTARLSPGDPVPLPRRPAARARAQLAAEGGADQLAADEIAAFAQQHKLDTATEQAVLDELLLLREGMVAVREDLKGRRINPADARVEMRALAIDAQARLAELLGEELAGALKHTLGSRWRAELEEAGL